ncbi:MAG: carboxypeptidase-like regulatory domain-containing protein, partial [Alistipes sp.]|nr:carboxypeptidase-like regulatory domain-containing protein [Alistipes sp.]
MVDSTGDPLVGVNIWVKDTDRGTCTDYEGQFRIDARMGDLLIFTYIGFVTEEVKVTSPHINIRMVEDTQTIQDVAITAYGVQTRKHFTGAATTISPSRSVKSRRQRQESPYSPQVS